MYHGHLHYQEFSVKFEYPIIFTQHIFSESNSNILDILMREDEECLHKVVVFVDSGVVDANPQIITDIKRYFSSIGKHATLVIEPQIVLGGHLSKSNWNMVGEMVHTIAGLHLDRQSFVIVIGGGGVLDVVGFVTSIVHRGLRLVRIPSTTLAQDDAGLGVKNGLDREGQKNFVGTFTPPFAVINDFSLLSTLSDEHWLGGVAEAFKVAIIKDIEFFEYLCANACYLHARDKRAMDVMVEIISRSSYLHLDHICRSGDPFESGSARPLDFGHWVAHKLEIMSKFRIAHGQAVSIGIAVDSFYAMKEGLIENDDFKRIVNGLLVTGLPIWDICLREKDADNSLLILGGVQDFREHLGGELNITLPCPIGSKVEVHNLNFEWIEEAINCLEHYVS